MKAEPRFKPNEWALILGASSGFGGAAAKELARHGIEACDYLLAVDVDMTPQAGYRFANWDTGYGDLEARIDPAKAVIGPCAQNNDVGFQR